MADHEVETMKAIILGAILGFGSIAPSLAALGSSRVSLVTPSTTSSSISIVVLR